MRIVAGQLGGRRLIGPSSTNTRPTTDLVREAVFNALNSLVDLDGLTVLDLFAGTGALGLEALSRGAKHVTFVEKDRKALDALNSNVKTLGVEADCTVVRGDVGSYVQSAPPFDIVLADPPYEYRDWSDLLGVIKAGLVVCETDTEIPAHGRWNTVRSRRYGTTLVTFLQPADTEIRRETIEGDE